MNSNRRHGFEPKTVRTIPVANNVAWDKIFCMYLGFPHQYHSTNAPSSHITDNTRSQLLIITHLNFPFRATKNSHLRFSTFVPTNGKFPERADFGAINKHNQRVLTAHTVVRSSFHAKYKPKVHYCIHKSLPLQPMHSARSQPKVI